MAKKVWVIEGASPPAPRPARPGRRKRPVSSTQLRVATGTVRDSPRTYRNWLPVLATYVLGPLVPGRRTQRGRIWQGLGMLGLAGGGALAGLRRPLSAWAAGAPDALGIFGAGVALVIVLLAGSWAAAVTRAVRIHPVRVPGWVRQPAWMGLLGLLLPGVGFAIVGRAGRAGTALGVSIAGIASLPLIVGGRDIWNAATGNGTSFPLLEMLLLGSAAVGGLCGLLWVLLALDGARRPEPAPGRGQVLAGALLASLALAAWVSPAEPLAGCLHRTAEHLRADGMRVAPLLLCQTAARLDPARPDYLVDTVELNDAIGRPEAADEARQLLRGRAAAYRDLPLTLRYPAELTSGGRD